MSEQDQPGKEPKSRRRPPSQSESRRARLDAALRANLQRRKEQIRSRGLDEDDDGLRDTPSILKGGSDRDGTS